MHEANRIRALRDAALDPVIDYRAFSYYFFESYLEDYGRKPYADRYADALYHAFDRAPVSIAPGELLVGRPAPLPPELEEGYARLEQGAMAAACVPLGQDSHMAIDYARVLELGLSGLRERIGSCRKTLDLTRAGDLEKDTFYAGCVRALEGVARFSARYAQEARRMAGEAEDPGRRAELLEVARICDKVPEYPAESFHEALQAVHFVTFCLSAKPMKPTYLQYQLGRPDRYLAAYYQADLAAGTLTRERAQTLLDCLGILINRRVPHGLSSGYMVGGRDAQGRVTTGELTRMLMQVIEDVGLVYPAVGLCVAEDTPQEDLRMACALLGKGFSHPALFNDEVIQAGLVRYGLSPGEACDYIHSNCVEITPIGASNCWVASPYTNLLQKLMDVLDREYDSMDALLARYEEHLAESIRANAVEESRKRLDRTRTVDPLLSCFVRDCLERGRDIEAGGARYNWIMPSFVGLANAADALAAVEALVMKERRFTIAQLRAMTQANWQGYERERQQVLHGAPKYGNGWEEADRYVREITEFLAEECARYTALPLGGRLIPSLFCWIMHDVLGRETGASPDGRMAGFPLGDGSGPAQGREGRGPTVSLLSSTAWDHTPFIGGVAVNLKFAKRLFTEGSLDKILAMVQVYMARGGFELQINGVDAETLRRAQAQPEAYQDLVVRIGGYSDYFVRLSPTMQAEILQRTEHSL